MTTHSSWPGSDPPTAPVIEVYWRPGCAHSRRLRSTLWAHRVEATWRNVLTDRDAERIAQFDDAGCLPVVRVDSLSLSNPTWPELAQLVGRDVDEPVRAVPARVYASAGACGPPPPSHPWAIDAARAAAVLILGFTSHQSSGHDHPWLAVLLGVAAALSWTMTRPGPR